MKIVYLKNNTTIGTQVRVKLTENQFMCLDGRKLEADDYNGNIEKEIAWYKENYSLVDATEKEFTEQYIKYVKYINPLASL